MVGGVLGLILLVISGIVTAVTLVALLGWLLEKYDKTDS